MGEVVAVSKKLPADLVLRDSLGLEFDVQYRPLTDLEKVELLANVRDLVRKEEAVHVRRREQGGAGGPLLCGAVRLYIQQRVNQPAQRSHLVGLRPACTWLLCVVFLHDVERRLFADARERIDIERLGHVTIIPCCIGAGRKKAMVNEEIIGYNQRIG